MTYTKLCCALRCASKHFGNWPSRNWQVLGHELKFGEPVRRLPIQNTEFLSLPDYLLANGSEIAQNELIMKCFLCLIAGTVAAFICSDSPAQEKATLQPNAT